MASIKEIRTHIKSVEQTLKITNAMYLISSSNLRKARKQLNDVEPYFRKIELTISDILHHSPEIHHPFFDKRPGIPPEKRKTGFIVVTADKGLRQDVEFLYTAQDPSTHRAREIAELMMDLYLDGKLDEVYILFTKMVNSFQMEPTVHKLLPLDPDVFPEFEANRDSYNRDVTYVPSVRAVMNRLVPGYIKGDIFGALVESYCSEQNARMTAMKSSSDNARAMLQTLNLSYNRARQSAITQEITEVVGGAQAAL